MQILSKVFDSNVALRLRYVTAVDNGSRATS